MAKNKDSKIIVQYNEEELTKNFFSLREESRELIYRWLFTADHNLLIVRRVVKYLLANNVLPSIIEELVIKWSILVSYGYYKKNKDYNINIKVFDDLLSKQYSINELKNAEIDDPFVYLDNLSNEIKKVNSIKEINDLIYNFGVLFNISIDTTMIAATNINDYISSIEKMFVMLRNDKSLTALSIYSRIFSRNEINKSYFNSNVEALREHLYFYDKRYLERHFIILKKGEDTTADKVLRLLKKNNNFFTPINKNTQQKFLFAFNKNINNLSIDRLISEMINGKNECVKFILEIEEKEFEKMFEYYKPKTLDKTRISNLKRLLPLFFGYMIYFIIKENDFTLKRKIKNIEHLDKLSYWGSSNDEMIKRVSKLYEYKFLTKDQYFSEGSNILPFTFKFNSEIYQFDSRHLLKL